MAETFNGSRAKSIYNHTWQFAAVAGALAFLQVKTNIFDRHGTLSMANIWGAAVGWFSGVFGAIGQVVSGVC